jgi:hypothetical protein
VRRGAIFASNVAIAELDTYTHFLLNDVVQCSLVDNTDLRPAYIFNALFEPAITRYRPWSLAQDTRVRLPLRAEEGMS